MTNFYLGDPPLTQSERCARGMWPKPGGAMIVQGAFTKGLPFSPERFKKDYSSMERRENWFFRLLIRLKLRKPRRVMVPGAFPKLFKPGLKRSFELAYKAEYLNDFPPEESTKEL